MAIQPEGPAPYAPTEAVTRTIEHHRNLGFRAPINSDVVSRVIDSDALAPRVMKALRLFDLVTEEGEPTEQFTELARAPSDAEFRERLADVIRAAYADVLQYIDPATVDAERLEGQFRRYTPVGQRERMVMLFRGLCEYAGIMPRRADQPEQQRRHPRPRRSGSGNGDGHRQRNTTTQREKQKTPNPDPPPASDAKQRYIDLLITKAQEDPNDALLDRIERALGIAPSPSGPGNGEGSE